MGASWLNPISHNKTLQSLVLELHNYYDPPEHNIEVEKWRQFVGNFKNSSLAHLEIPCCLDQSIKDLAESITSENKKLDSQLQTYKEKDHFFNSRTKRHWPHLMHA